MKEIFLVFSLLITSLLFAKEEQMYPPARSSHSAIYDLVGKQMIIFGGVGQPSEKLSDTWTFDIEKKEWKEIKTEETPTGRWNPSAIYDPVGKQMLVFGGNNPGGIASDLWMYDIEKKKWKEIETEETPPQRQCHSAVYDESNKQMIIFGGEGQIGQPFSDTWTFNIENKEWKEIEVEDVPPPRVSHSAIYDPVGKQMLVCVKGKGQVLLDIWTFNIEKKEWKKIETEDAPLARDGHSAIYDPVGKQMIIFGGVVQWNRVSDIWTFDIEKKRWEEIKIGKDDNIPGDRAYHSAIYDSLNKQMIIFGGSNQTGQFLSDTWTFDIEKKEWEKIKIKSEE